MSERVLVTGSSGFIGTNVVAAFRAAGNVVLGFDLAPPVDPAAADLHLQGDIVDRDALIAAVTSFAPTWIVHLAAETGVQGRRLEDFVANVGGVANLIEAIRRTPSVRRTVFTSTKLVCRNDHAPTSFDDYCPDTPYGESKVRGEQLVRASGLESEWSIVRPTGMWGPWFHVPYRGFFEMVARGRYLHPAGTDAPKLHGYVGNAVHEIRSILEAPREQVHEQIFYLSDYEPFVIRDWADLISRETRGRPVRTMPAVVIRAAALAGDLLQRCGWKEPPLTSFRLRNMRARTDGLPLDNLREVVGPLPYDLAAGVRETVAWLRQQGAIPPARA